MILMRALSITRALGRGGPRNRDLNGNERCVCLLSPKKSRLTKGITVLTKVITILTKNNTVLTKVNRVRTKENTVLTKVNTVDY